MKALTTLVLVIGLGLGAVVLGGGWLLLPLPVALTQLDQKEGRFTLESAKDPGRYRAF